MNDSGVKKPKVLHSTAEATDAVEIDGVPAGWTRGPRRTTRMGRLFL